MRRIEKMTLMLGLVLLLAVVVGAQPKSKSKIVQKSGRVEAGAEAGCLVLRDTRDHKLYNVFFASGEKPQVGDEIQFSATRHIGPTTCMQGIPVDVTAWKPLKAADEATK